MPFDLPNIKLLCLHVSEHRDEAVVRPIWNQIFEESEHGCLPILSAISFQAVARETPDVSAQKDTIFKQVVSFGQRFYPSECAFPLRMLYSPCHLATGV